MTYSIDKSRKEYTYAEKVISGEYLACELEVLACKRFMRDLERQNDVNFPYCYDSTRADRFFMFYEKCPNPDVQGETLKLSHFQYFDYGNIFGWVEKETGIRRFTRAIDMKARGGFKSTGAAVVCLYVMASDAIYLPYDEDHRMYEMNPNVVVLAVDKEQTKEVRGVAVSMVKNSLFLSKLIKVGRGNNKSTYIISTKRDGEMIAISSEIGTQDGGKPNLIVRDEAAAHKEEDRFNTLCGGQGKKMQSLAYSITTASDDAMHKPFKNDYDKCKEILHGRIIDENYFVIIRELDEKDDPSDFSLYEKCSPVFRDNTRYSRGLLKTIKSEYERAFNGGTEKAKIEYLIKRTNRWQVGSEQKYLTQEQLDKLVASQVDESEFWRMVRGKGTVCGVDKSVKVDLTAEAFIFNLPDGKVGIYAHGFMPKETLHTHKQSDNLPYEAYEKKGYLSFIDGTIIDDTDLKQFIADTESERDIEVKAVCADNAFCGQLLIDLNAGRAPNGKIYDVIEIPQTTTHLNEPCMNFIKWLIADKLVVCRNELFIQHCANAYVEYDKGGRMKVSKKDKNSTYRIDLLAAVLDALVKKDLLESENILNAIASGTFSF